jgi:fumarylpyruvate hydrolase
MKESNAMSYVLPPPPLAALLIRSSDSLFPVHRIYCVGRNYAAHAVEMGHDPDKDPPFFFQKNPDNLVTSGAFPYPSATSDVHHEIELVVGLGTGGTDIARDAALACVYGYAVGLDMTRRDLQQKARDMGRPWEIGKAFESSAPCSALVPASAIGHPSAGAIWLDVNGIRRQSGDLNQLIWKVPEIISHLSGLFTLMPGDLIFSGTPSGVGPVNRGDRLTGHVEGVGTLDVTVV